MREVDLYTLKKEKVLVTSDYISVATYTDQDIHIRGSDEFIVNAPVEVTNIPVEYYQEFSSSERSVETVSAYLVAFDPKIRKLLGINEKELKDKISENDKVLKETLVAFDPKIRELLGINEKQLKDKISENDKVLKDTLVKNWELTEEKYKLQEQYNSALKTNENLVEYKNDLLRENATLVEKLFINTTMSFWKRLVFLFTGKVN